MKTIRSFLAVNISLETARSIAEKLPSLMERFDQAGMEVRWVPPQNMHVTLHFLGNITEPMVRAVADNIEQVTKSFPQVELEASGLGVFPSVQEPRVLWVGIHSKDDQLKLLHDKLAIVLEETGFKMDGNAFRAHVTIGRIKKAEPAALEEILAAEGDTGFGTSSPKELVCYRSDLHKKGADYHLLWRLPFVGKTPGPKMENNEPSAPAEDKE